MKDSQRLPHTVWEGKYHLVFIPQYRRKTLFPALRKDLGPVFRDLARRKGCRVEEGHLRPDHVHMLVSIPPKYAVAAVVGYLKGKSAIHFARTYRGKEHNFTGEHFWARGYVVSTVGWTNTRCGSTSATRKKRTFGSINSSCFSRTETALGGSQTNLRLCRR